MSRLPENFTVSVIIPAHNEESQIQNIVQRVRQVDASFEIIVVDDGSEDQTASLAQAGGADEVIVHPYNIGNGAAVKTGIRSATGHVVVMLDADGQHPPEKIPELLEKMAQYTMAVGSRTKTSNVSRFRGVGNFILRRIGMYLVEGYIADLTSGFRAIHRDVLLEYVHLFPNTYSYPTTITLSLLKDGYPVAWVPMPEIQRRQSGQSGIRPLHDGIRFIALMIRIIMLFSPQKVFLPIGFFFLVIGIYLSIFTIQRNQLEDSAVLVVMIGVFVLLFGLIAEQLSTIRRELRR
ncbi:MAG: glycosyltransferase family 2 protein [Anaerolineales bacterium]